MANSIYEMFTAGVDRGQQRKERRTLSDYLQPALAGDQQAQAAIYGANPDTGMKVEGLAQQRTQSASEAARKRAADLSNVMLRAPQMAAQVYPQFKQAYEGLGLGITLPDQYEEGALDLAKALVPSAEGEQYTLAPGAARYGPDGRLIAERPFAPIKPEYQLYDGADGPTWIPKPMAGPQAAPSAMPPAGGAVDPVRDFGDLSGIPGVKTTSLFRDPERNARVGGVANSFHTKGQAGDFVVPQDQKAAFIQRARDMGYEALDEGDHVHVEPRRGARAASAFGPGQGVAAIPVQGVRPKPKADDKPSALQEKLATARAMGATEDQLRQIVMGESGGGKPSATQIKLANTAKSKLIDLRAMENQLAQVEAAFRPLRGSLSAGMGGDLVPTVEGKRFDAAVALLKGMARKLTRTPGEGAMSDYESKLAELANPSRGEYEEVTADQITQLRALIETTRQGYEAMLQDAGGSSANLSGPPSADRRQPSTVQPTPKRLKFNPATGRIE